MEFLWFTPPPNQSNNSPSPLRLVIWYTKATLLHKPTFPIQLAAGAEIINTFEPDFVDFLSEKSTNSVKIQAYRPESVSKQGIIIIEAVKPQISNVNYMARRAEI